MAGADLEEVAAIADGAFISVIGSLTGQQLTRPFFSPAGLALRLATDPEGCLVAVDSGRLTGAILSVRRGSQGWFGPLAVDTAMQGRGIGQALVAEVRGFWSASGVRLMGLETFGQSAAHVHLYSKLGFQPGWVGVQLTKSLEREATASTATAPAPLQHPRLPLPDLGFLYPGFDPVLEVRATIQRGVGRVFASHHGLAIVHVRDAFHVTAEEAFIPLVAADGPDTFRSLVAVCEEAARTEGFKSISTRLPGTAVPALEALVERGYRVGATMLRMKSGTSLDYDRDAWYCDDWQ